MVDRIMIYLKDVVMNEGGASEVSINELQKQVDFEFPSDYKELMIKYNGGEGEIGDNGWLVLFPIEELIPTNSAYSLLMSQIPEYFLFGKDAADTGFAFHKQNGTVHSFGLMSDFETDPIEFCGRTILEFLDFLSTQ